MKNENLKRWACYYHKDKLLHKIMIKENERLIKSNGFTIEKFEQLPDEKQEQYIEYWKDMAAKEKRTQKFDSYETASLKLLGDYLKESEDHKRVKEYKAKLSEEIERKRMGAAGLAPNANLQSLTRMEWNRQRVMYFFKKQDEIANEDQTQEGEQDIFNLRFKRKIFTKKEREKKLQEQRAQYSERFERAAYGFEDNDPEYEERHSSISDKDEKIIVESVRQPVFQEYKVNHEVKDMDELNEISQSSEDSLFKPAKSRSSKSDKADRIYSDTAQPGMMEPRATEFDNYLQAELSKFDNEISNNQPGRGKPILSRPDEDSVKPILDDNYGRQRKVIPRGYFERKNQPKKRRGRGGKSGKNMQDGSEDEEEEKMEAEFMRQMAERPLSGKAPRESGEDWQTLKTTMQKLFDDPIQERVRRSRDSASQKMLSFGEEDVGSNVVIFDWLNREEVDVKELPPDSNENTNAHSVNFHNQDSVRQAGNILEFFSGGFLREDQQPSNEQRGFAGAKIHSLQREFLQPKVPVGKKAGDPLDDLKKMLKALGVPWIQSPTEAEAQCAQLELEGLADGTVSEDCDSFLFGSKRVIRGLFGTSRRPEEYRSETIEAELGLDREQLVMLALFLGCDYCLGIRGVGIVNAIEIVDAYSNLDALDRFKIWAEKPDYWLDTEIYQKCKEEHPKEYDYMQKHKNYKKEWDLPETFPNRRVVDAFFNPEVKTNLAASTNTESLNPSKVISFAKSTFKLDSRALEMIQQSLEREASKRSNPQINEFFRPVPNKIDINSRRLKTSIQSLRVNKLDQAVSDAIGRKSTEEVAQVRRLQQEGVITRKSDSHSEESIELVPRRRKRPQTSEEDVEAKESETRGKEAKKR